MQSTNQRRACQLCDKGDVSQDRAIIHSWKSSIKKSNVHHQKIGDILFEKNLPINLSFFAPSEVALGNTLNCVRAKVHCFKNTMEVILGVIWCPGHPRTA